MERGTIEYEVKPIRKSVNSIYPSKNWIDVTVPIFNSLVHWPGDPPVSVDPVNDMARGDSNNVSKICMGSHTGTHVDAPRHFYKDGEKITAMPPSQTIGVTRVIEIHDSKCISTRELEEHNIRPGERLLFKTRNSARPWYHEPFDEDFIYISNEAADFLASKYLKVVGIDYLSVAGFKADGTYIHRTLLGSGIWLIEGLDLSDVHQGKYYLVCLPLKLESGDGAPARVFLRPLKQ
jgi:arylformamidase